ncbi:sensor histidine kinase [Actinoplanes sp. NBRC 103695]|uniref:sensor histidine kinase n=1 Tax=Actinoplanes sp. NBRC 103695 TaxID=3032202 RepID=UPI002553F9A4|nr:sensor histidine kinase [Actinoplanes sp. NBRC 103695]
MNGSGEDRPRLIGALFWGCLASIVVLHLVRQDETTGVRWLMAGLLISIVLLWPALRWRQGSGRWAVTGAFELLAVIVGALDGSGVSLFLILIVLSNITLAFGLRAGAINTGVLVAVLFAMQILAVHRSPAEAAYEALAIALYGIFVMTLATAVNEARSARDRADRLRAELAEAHQELRRHSERAHELAVAEERVRMARELHDSVGHHLTVVKVGLENAERWREREPEAVWQDVRQAKTLTADALQEIRRVVRALHPPRLDGGRGGAVLRELARTFRGTGLDVDVTVRGEERPLDEERGIVLFRALQESLTNALRHSGGSRVEARLDFVPGAVRLSVTDDGRGAAGTAHGFGLTALADRVRDAGGVLHAGDADGGGFLVRVELPEPA